MADAVIRVSDIGKMYQIGVARRSTDGLRHVLESGLQNLGRRLRGGAGAPPSTEEFWALKGVSFDVQRGECVGVIGRNGAGKSTLLKVLSRITEPTTGEVALRGRVGSLLEVGTGFHQELSGRENIFLNGAILGMRRKEIAAKFDEIVAFAGVEQFLDTPVKRYSSGMYVRLAFAVAAHLEPEILIVDEVLAVGDATFQKRCLDRMSELVRSGLTVLFVSHNMEVVPRLCQKAILLQSGQIKSTGPAAQVTGEYLADLTTASNGNDLGDRFRVGSGRARFRRVRALDARGQEVAAHRSGDDLTFRLTVESEADVADVGIAIVLQSLYGNRIVTSWNREVGAGISLRRGVQEIDCTFHRLNLRPGHQLQVQLWMEAGEVLDSVDGAGMISVIESPETVNYSRDAAQGIMLCPHSWAVSGTAGAHA